LTVVENVAVEASENITKPQHSAVPLQAIQSKSLNRTVFLENSIRPLIWFGTRGSEVQILSPRPI
jgi:hypothetical protein